jgi:ABC-type sugar transport system permease subunit
VPKVVEPQVGQKSFTASLAAPRARRGLERLVTRGLVPYYFLAPAVLIYAAFLVAPMVTSLWYSLTSWSGSGAQHFVGLSNYRSILSDPVSLLALKNTLIWAGVMVTVPTILGLLLANLLKGKGWWKGPGQAILYLPAVLPMIGVAVLWGWIYNPQFGFLNSLLDQLGLGSLTLDWLGSGNTVLPALLVAGIWVSLGFPVILYTAGLQTISPELYEAARVDGGRRWTLFRYITIPGLRQMHIVIIALEVISALQVFAIIYALTAGGPGNISQMLGTWMYFNIFSFHKVGYGSAIGWVLAAMALVVTIPYVLWMTRGESKS